jgi:hypothetical protein
MGKSLRLVVAMSALVLVLVSAGAWRTMAAAPGPAVPESQSQAAPNVAGASCPLDTSRCTPVVPTSPAGLMAVAGLAFLAGGRVVLEQARRRMRRPSSVGRLAAGVHTVVVRPPKVRPTFP